jgi:hypothetical protein
LKADRLTGRNARIYPYSLSKGNLENRQLKNSNTTNFALKFKFSLKPESKAKIYGRKNLFRFSLSEFLDKGHPQWQCCSRLVVHHGGESSRKEESLYVSNIVL